MFYLYNRMTISVNYITINNSYDFTKLMSVVNIFSKVFCLVWLSNFILHLLLRSLPPPPTLPSTTTRHILSICHWFNVEIPLILKGESTWKLWHRFDIEISTWIGLSKSTKYRWVLHVDFSTSNQRNFSTRSFHSIIF